MKEVDKGVWTCRGDDKLAMKTCQKYDQEATLESVPLVSHVKPSRAASHAKPSRTDEGVEASIIDVDINIDMWTMGRLRATQPRSMIR